MTKEEQITRLNEVVKVRLAPSKVHGVGVVAMRDIPAGTRLNANLFPQTYDVPYSSFGKLFPEIKGLLLERWPHIVNGSKFMWPDCPLQGYMNHSDTPNYGGITDTTLKDIKAGEEIFEDYRAIPNYEKIFTWLDKDKVV